MLVIALLSVLSLAGISASTLEVKIAGNDRESKQAFFLCEAGLETAKYQIVKGWGKGTGGGAAPNWTFTFDAATVPTSMQAGGPFEWSTDRWENFTLVDSRGVAYTIKAHDTAYGVTNCIGPTDKPADGYARVLYEDNGVAESYSGTVAGTLFQITPSPGWTTDQWAGYLLRDQGTPPGYFPILNNTADTITFSGGTPTGLTLDIIRAVGGANTFVLYENPIDTDEVGGPNDQWRSNGWDLAGLWYLRDRTGEVFAITATSYATLPDRMILTVDGTPESGSFQLISNPWLEWLEANGPLSYTPSAPSTINYGTVDLSVASATTSGRYTLAAVSTSTTTGNTKEIQMDVQLGEGSRALVRDWRLVR